MLAIAYYLLQVILCSVVMMAYYWLALRNKRFHQYNRFYLITVAILSWLVPLIKIQWSKPQVPDQRVINFLSLVAHNNSELEAAATQNGFQWNWPVLATVFYLAVSGILLFMMLKALYRLFLLLRTHSCRNMGDIHLILTRAEGTPFSFFRYIFWNEEIDIRSQAGKQILKHELAHVQQKHSIDKILIQLLLIVGWINPIFWILKKEMEMIHEFIADKKAVNNGDTTLLAQMLLTAAYPKQQFALAHPFFFSPIKRRLQMLANNKDPRFSYMRRLVVLPLLATVIVLFAFRAKEDNVNEVLSVETTIEKLLPAKVDKPQSGTAITFQNVVQEKLKPVLTGNNPVADTIAPPINRVIIHGNVNSTFTAQSDSGMITKPNVFNKEPLFIINGKKMDNNFALNDISPADIHSINVIKDPEVISAKYGVVRLNGAVEIITNDAVVLREAGLITEFRRSNPDIKSVFHKFNKLEIELKDGTEEKYNLSNPESVKRAESKYGKLPIAEKKPGVGIQ